MISRRILATALPALTIFGASGAMAQTISYGQSASGNLAAGDATLLDDADNEFYVDYYEFQGNAGDRIVITLNSNVIDPYISLFKLGADYAFVENDDFSGLNAQVDVVLPEAGTYQIGASSAAAMSAGAYTLTLNRTATGQVATITNTNPQPATPAPQVNSFTPGPLPRPGGTASAQGGTDPVSTLLQQFSGAGSTAAAGPAPAAGTLAYGQTVQGNLQKGDRMYNGKLEDSYRFTGRAGEFIVIDMVATYDTYVRLARASAPETQIAYDDDTGDGLNARLGYRLNDGGEYIVYATTAGTDVTGPYSLSVQLMAPPSTDTRPLEAGRQVKTMLTDGDPTNLQGMRYQLYRFEAQQGQQVTITMRSLAFDTYLRLYNANDIHGEQLTYDDDGAGDGDSRIVYTAPRTGEYVVMATTYGTDGRGAFSLDLTRP